MPCSEPDSLAAAAIGVAAAVALGVGDDEAPPPRATATPTASATAAAAAEGMTADDEVEVGRRPNVVRAVGDTVFVGSFLSDRLNLVSTKTGKVRSYAPRVGVGVNDAAVSGNSVWLAVGRAHQLVRLNAKTGRLIGNPIKLPGPASSVAATRSAIWVALVPGEGAPDTLLKIDPKTGQTVASVEYPWGIGSITTSPTAVWVAARRRARIQRVDPATGEVVKTLQIGRSRSTDIVYRDGSLWLATPDDNTVYKVSTRTGDAIPISVGQQPRQLAVGKDTVYVTNFSSSDLYAIDAEQQPRRGRAARALGEPVLALGRGRHDLGRQRAREPPDQGHKSRRVITPVRSA